jgi:glycosyltransferase involved in cell wall biosynthesis
MKKMRQDGSLSYLDMPVTLIGHPFAPIGRGEDLRSCYRALKAAGLSPTVVNVYGGRGNDRELEEEIGPAVREETAGGIDVFVINGDEVEPVLGHLGPRRAPSARSVVYPVWELSEYPASWVRPIECFDEVWVPSVFIRDAMVKVVRKPVKVFPWSTGVRLGRFFGRRFFGIRESAYAFLFAFDHRSYVERKNPFAVVQALAEVMRARPAADVVLVIKITGSNERKAAAEAFGEELRARTREEGLGRIVLIDRELTDTETKNLVRCCDCFVSLHRSEGFGRFLAEAMLLGKPVVATGYSGNLDFMNPDVSCLVGFTLVPVAPGAYPFGEGQVWADADVGEAASWMVRLVDNPAWGRQLGERASRHIRTRFCYRAVGLQYLDGLRDLCER